MDQFDGKRIVRAIAFVPNYEPFGISPLSLNHFSHLVRMTKLVQPQLILPSFRESTIPKKAIANNVTLDDLGKSELAFPFLQLITKLESINERSLSAIR